MPKDPSNQMGAALFEEMCRSEYVPNNLTNFEDFKEKKSREFCERYEKLYDNAFRGILNFSLIDTANERVQLLSEKFMNLDQNSVFENTDVGTIAKEIEQHNIFGLEESDFDELLEIADTFYKMGSIKESIEMYQAVIVLFPDRFESWLKWAHAISENNFDYKQVLDIYTQCLSIFDHPAIYFLSGVCHLRGNELGLAQECFNKALEQCDKYDEQELKAQIVEVLKEMPHS